MRVTAFVSPVMFWRRLIAGFLFGFILGTVGTIFCTGKRMESLILEKSRLRSELSKEETKVEQLSESLKERKMRVVTSIKLEIDSKETIYGPLIEEYIHSLLGDLVGMEVSRVEPKLIWQIINHRELKIKEKFFRIVAQWILINEEVSIGVEVKPTGDGVSE